jgi:hypothetical protein
LKYRVYMITKNGRQALEEEFDDHYIATVAAELELEMDQIDDEFGYTSFVIEEISPHLQDCEVSLTEPQNQG